MSLPIRQEEKLSIVKAQSCNQQHHGLKKSPMKTVHVVQGNKHGDKDWVEQAAKKGLKSNGIWIVPKSAQPSDTIIIYIGGIGLFATGTVLSNPTKRADLPNRYGATVGEIQLIDPPISIGTLLEQVPQLTWAVYPRSYTTPSPAIARRLITLIAKRRRNGLSMVSKEFVQYANLAELRAFTLATYQATTCVRRREVNYRDRSDAIRRYALLRSEGYCEGCGLPAPFQGADGSPFLEVHHLTRVADEGPDHPANVAALCPNCHRRAHASADAHRFGKMLRKAIEQIEDQQ